MLAQGARREGRRGCAPSGHKFPSKSRSKRQLPARPRVKWRKASEKREEEASREASRSLSHLRFDPRRRLSPVSQRPVDQPSRFFRANVASISASVSFSDPITGDYVEMI